MKNRISVSINLVLVIVILVLLTSGFAAGSNPGTATDPIVTQSYVESRLNALSTTLDGRLTELENRPISSGGSLNFEVLSLEAGQIIHLKANSQFILRSGSATAIAGQGGGLSDLTVGNDLATGESLTLNHLLLIPKSDGRGVKITEFAWVMVSGGYTIDE